VAAQSRGGRIACASVQACESLERASGIRVPDGKRWSSLEQYEHRHMVVMDDPVSHTSECPALEPRSAMTTQDDEVYRMLLNHAKNLLSRQAELHLCPHMKSVQALGPGYLTEVALRCSQFLFY
jgi:hypothetical protein